MRFLPRNLNADVNTRAALKTQIEYICQVMQSVRTRSLKYEQQITEDT